MGVQYPYALLFHVASEHTTSSAHMSGTQLMEQF